MTTRSHSYTVLVSSSDVIRQNLLTDSGCMWWHNTNTNISSKYMIRMVDDNVRYAAVSYIHKYFKTSGQSNLTKMPHRHRTWTAPSYSPGFANIHPSPSNMCFLGPTRVHTANGISIGSAVLQGSRSWQTDHPTASCGLITTRPTSPWLFDTFIMDFSKLTSFLLVFSP